MGKNKRMVSANGEVEKKIVGTNLIGHSAGGGAQQAMDRRKFLHFLKKRNVHIPSLSMYLRE